MPELPDISAYITALELRILNQPLERVRLGSVFLLRTVDPPLASAEGRPVRELRRIGKRIAIGVEGDLWLVLHLMIAGRLHWKPPGAKLAGRNALAAFDFPSGSLVLTEAGSKRRASLHVLQGEEGLRSVDPGGVEVFSTGLDGFRTALTQENRTLKRALTDPRLISGVGNAYSDEILHAAQLSPIALTHKLKSEEWERLFSATRSTLAVWMDRLHAEALESSADSAGGFTPVTAVIQTGINGFGDAAPNTTLFGQPVARANWQVVIPGGQDAPSNADVDITRIDDVVLHIAHTAQPRGSGGFSVDYSCLSNTGGGQ